MSDTLRAIDIMIDVDKKLIEGFDEWSAMGSCSNTWNVYHTINELIPFAGSVTINKLLHAISQSSMTNTGKWWFCAAIACDFQYIAVELGFINKLRERR